MDFRFLDLFKRKPTPEVDLSFSEDCLEMRKDAATGEYLLMTVFSNKYRDRDVHAAPHKGGEIVSDRAHRAYVEFLDQNPDLAPELWTIHTPGTARKNRAHWWDYDGSFIYAEFRLTADEALGVSEFAKVYEPGLSHGFYVFDYDKDNAVIDDYYTFEVSILPLEMAANPWTTFELLRKEQEMGKFTPERRAVLVVAHGEEYVANLESKGDEMRAHLDELEVESKSLKTVETPAAVAAVAIPVGVTEEAIVALLNTFQQSLAADMQVFVDRVAGLEKRLEEFETSENDRVEQKAAAYVPGALLASWKPASVIGRDETEVKPKEALKKAQPAGASATNGHLLGSLFGGN